VPKPPGTHKSAGFDVRETNDAGEGNSAVTLDRDALHGRQHATRARQPREDLEGRSEIELGDARIERKYHGEIAGHGPSLRFDCVTLPG
jgi:hypothetical protein